jgi:hypothetical protein
MANKFPRPLYRQKGDQSVIWLNPECALVHIGVHVGMSVFDEATEAFYLSA